MPLEKSCFGLIASAELERDCPYGFMRGRQLDIWKNLSRRSRCSSRAEKTNGGEQLTPYTDYHLRGEEMLKSFKTQVMMKV